MKPHGHNNIILCRVLVMHDNWYQQQPTIKKTAGNYIWLTFNNDYNGRATNSEPQPVDLIHVDFYFIIKKKQNVVLGKH